MGERPAFEREERLGLFRDWVHGQARGLVLFDRAVGRRFELRFELQRGDRDAVDEEDEVNSPRLGLHARGGEFGPGRPRAVNHLRHDAQAVFAVAGEGCRG